MRQHSELCFYAPENPDPQFPGCRNTGELGDGVVFNGFEPHVGHVGFIGRTSINEAAAVLYDLTVEEVVAALKDGTSKQKAAIKARDAKIKALEDELYQVYATIARVLDKQPEDEEIR